MFPTVGVLSGCTSTNLDNALGVAKHRWSEVQRANNLVSKHMGTYNKPKIELDKRYGQQLECAKRQIEEDVYLSTDHEEEEND